MASCMTVLLYTGYDRHNTINTDLHKYLISELPEEVGGGYGQHLTTISGREIQSDLPGSGQAGTIRVYGGLIRRGRSTTFIEWMKKAPQNPWGILIIEDDCSGESLIIRTSEWSK